MDTMIPMSKSKRRGCILRPAVVTLLLCILSLLHVRPAHSQVVQTSFGVFQAINKEFKLVVSYQEPLGLFIIVTRPIELQLFNLATVPADDTLHAFIRYSPEVDRYVSLHIGAKELRIKGNFTMLLTKGTTRARLTVDNNNPYLSILIDTDSKDIPASLIGFRGIDPVANYTGSERVALLEATQLDLPPGIIEPYSLKTDGLWLKGQKVETPSIGIEMEPPKNLPCLKPGAVFIDQRDLNELRKLNPKESLPKLEALLSTRPAGEDPFRGMLLLRMKPSEIVGLNYISGVVKIIRPLHPFLKEQRAVICAVQVVELE